MTNLPVTVIGGYLGAGKTTLLNHLLTRTKGLRIAALVNDFGSVNIDADLIKSHDGETISLANGCMCCSLAGGFAEALAPIRARSVAFDHVIIEASGVADPARIAREAQAFDLALDGILVVVDAEQVRTQAVNKYVGDTVLRQFAQADLLLLNKADLATAEERARLRAWLAEQAPGTPMIETVRSEVPLDVILGTHEGRFPAPPNPEESHHEDHAHTFQSWTIERSSPVSRQVMGRFAAGLGEDIYRAKGFVWVEDDPERRQVYQQVGARWSLEPGAAWGADPKRTRIVVIGRMGATSAAKLEKMLSSQ